RAELVQLWRGATVDRARLARLPRDLGRIRVEPTAHFRGRPPVRDSSNLEPTLKACIDGLGPSRILQRKGRRIPVPGYGLIPDDDDAHLELERLKIGAPLEYKPYANAGELVLLITDLTS